MSKQKTLSGLDALAGLKVGADGKLEKTNDTKPDKGKPVTPIPIIPNLGWLYYKDYFSDIDWKRRDEKEYTPFGNKNQQLLEYSYQSHGYNLDKSIVSHRFPLKTTYPGLVCGTGTSHEVAIEGEFKLGCSFDHTTGLPIIPASSVKGLLRSLFKNKDAHEFLQELLQVIAPDKKVSIDLLDKAIFEGIRDGKAVSLCKRDIFFDAVLISQSKPVKIMEADYITPHINRKNPELSRLTNPVPIQFIKVRPNISFEFRFYLIDGIITATQKQELFKSILTYIGIGAKTNVGYGQLQ